jgi:trans-2-enoyl-CoA reductase
MKGQVFMIVSVFILLFLFLLRINTQTIDVKPEDLFYKDFSNLKNELVKTIDISLLNQENLQNNLNDFIAFSKDFYNNKGYKEDVNYSISTSGDVTTVYLNISLTSSNSYLKQNLIINRTLSVFT